MGKIIKLPMGVKVDVFNLPEDFDDIIKRTFYEYTEGTAEDYRFCDQLIFIDHVIESITCNDDEYDKVEEICTEHLQYSMGEYGEIPDKEEYYSVEFMQECYKKGVNDTRLYQHYGSDDHHVYDAIQKAIVRIITVVMSC